MSTESNDYNSCKVNWIHSFKCFIYDDFANYIADV